MFMKKTRKTPKPMQLFRSLPKPVRHGLTLAAGLGVASLMFALVIAPAARAAGSADINGDGQVNITDLSILLARYGSTDPAADINGNGTVDITDLSILLAQYGSSTTPSP
jgi:hypothetical protein